MKKKTLILLVLIISTVNLYSQGFDWQYSARLPFEEVQIITFIIAILTLLKMNFPAVHLQMGAD